MTARVPRPAAARGGPAGAAEGARSRPDPVAVSPDLGPVPPIYVPRTPPETTWTGLLWRAAVRVGLMAASRAIRYLDRRRDHARHSRRSAL